MTNHRAPDRIYFSSPHNYNNGHIAERELIQGSAELHTLRGYLGGGVHKVIAVSQYESRDESRDGNLLGICKSLGR